MRTFKQLKEPKEQDIELANLNDPTIPAETEFYQWLQHEIINLPPTSRAENIVGKIGFLFGAAGTTVLFNLGYLFGMNLARALNLDPKSSEAFAYTLATLVWIPRIVLSGNSAQYAFQDIFHKLYSKIRLPKKNNQPLLRYAAKSIDLGIVGLSAYVGLTINNKYLTVPMGVKYILLVVACITSLILTLKPMLDKADASFAKWSPGSDEDVRTKRAALLHSTNGALQVLRKIDKERFKSIQSEMKQAAENGDMPRSFKALLDLAKEAEPATPLNMFAKFRGILGWIIAALAACTNIRAVYAGSEDGPGSEILVPILVTASVVVFTFLWAGPTQRLFQGIPRTPEWQKTHPQLEYIIAIISVILGIISSLPHAYWPLVKGEYEVEKALVPAAIMSPGALYAVNLSDRLHLMLNSYDECQGNNEVNELVKFLKRLQTLPAAIASLPDKDVLALVPDETTTQNSIVTHYYNRTATQKNLIRSTTKAGIAI